MIRHSIALLMLVCALLASETAHAQSWPQRPVKFVLPLGPGSGTDIGARLISDRLAARWGQPVVIENRPGGDGMVAISAFVGARDDHVLLFSPSSSFTAHPYLHENLPYKPSDLAPIARFSNTIISIAVPRSLRLDTLAQLFELARAQPGKLNWAGTTGATDFIFAGLAKRAGAEMTKVPYRNPVEAANDLGEGRVQAYASALAIVRPQLEAGKIRLLAVYNSVRAPTAPDIPTVAEAGFPEMTMDGLVGLFGPPEMPLDLRERIAGDVQAVSDASVAERLLTTGQILNTGGPAAFDAAVEEQRAKIAAIAHELGIKPGQ
jgi:tripartite-type tricarboxylate transporter receptor subunit TctC